MTPITIESVRREIQALYTSKGSSRNFTAEEQVRYQALLAAEERLLRTSPRLSEDGPRHRGVFKD